MTVLKKKEQKGQNGIKKIDKDTIVRNHINIKKV